MKVRVEQVGGNVPVIEQYGLGEKVLALRRNLTLKEVTERINKFVPEGAPRIGISQIHQYCVKHGETGSRQLSVAKLKKFDSFNDAVEVRDRIVRHTRKLDRIIEQIKEDEERLSEISSVSNAYLNACKCLLEVNKTISRIEKEHLGHEKVRKVLKTLLEILDEFPDVKTRFMEKLRESTVYDTIKFV